MNQPIVEGVLRTVFLERARQDKLKSEGRFKNTPNEASLFKAHAMLSEEMGEIARCILSQSGEVQEKLTVDDLRKELIQLAAVAVAIVEGIEERQADRLPLYV